MFSEQNKCCCWKIQVDVHEGPSYLLAPVFDISTWHNPWGQDQMLFVGLQTESVKPLVTSVSLLLYSSISIVILSLCSLSTKPLQRMGTNIFPHIFTLYFRTIPFYKSTKITDTRVKPSEIFEDLQVSWIKTPILTSYPWSW